MDTIPVVKCAGCERPLADDDDAWHSGTVEELDGFIYCDDCVQLIPRKPPAPAPLTAPAGWGPAPMGSAKMARPTDVQAERSEPSGKP